MGHHVGYAGGEDVAVGLVLGYVLFALVTLPVEFEASRRAVAVLQGEECVLPREAEGVRVVRNAAAPTYVATARPDARARSPQRPWSIWGTQTRAISKAEWWPGGKRGTLSSCGPGRPWVFPRTGFSRCCNSPPSVDSDFVSCKLAGA
ncbi:MAG: zinc metallopeptidase [Armatimonadota bacterium]|nr:zinc metallopeptidase [Armatimonadota bacterium]MDR7519362.1 zinc metallopeptidase [Armatimonadota bacterium]MDR7549515.1 zinc metallopeptidase [Armatimonadota bacterium]